MTTIRHMKLRAVIVVVVVGIKMNFTKNVLQEIKNSFTKNIQEVRDNINKPWVQTKIENYLSRSGNTVSKKELATLILTNDTVASFFCKNPNKQNISELLAIKLLKVEKLSPSGKNSIRFDDTGEITTIAIGNTKTADFIYHGWYVTQKWTMDFGGAQDNQRNDVIDFLTRGSKKHKVAAIVDGSYWDKYRPILKQYFKDNPNVWITSITELTGGADNER